MPVRGQPRNPLGQRSTRFHRLRTFGGDTVAVDAAGERPSRFHETIRVFVAAPGETPGTTEHDLRTGTEAAGTVRRWWRQVAGTVPAPPPFQVSREPLSGQRQKRYKASTYYRGAGDQLRFSRFGNPGMHTVIVQATRQPVATLGAGARRNPPTVRNRISSFGSRVAPLNPRIRAAVGGGGES